MSIRSGRQLEVTWVEIGLEVTWVGVGLGSRLGSGFECARVRVRGRVRGRVRARVRVRVRVTLAQGALGLGLEARVLGLGRRWG